MVAFDRHKTFVINLPERTERLRHIKKQFRGKNEFEINIIKFFKHKVGAFNLWKRIVNIVELATTNNDVIIICEDDHEFTNDYSKSFLLKNIIEANEQGVDILSGGSGGFGQVVLPIAADCYWINPMLSTQFLVIYRKFFHQLLNYRFSKNNSPHEAIFKLVRHKMLFYPSISIQKDFCNSDITEVTEERKGFTNMFNETALRLQNLKSAYLKYVEKI